MRTLVFRNSVATFGCLLLAVSALALASCASGTSSKTDVSPLEKPLPNRLWSDFSLYLVGETEMSPARKGMFQSMASAVPAALIGTEYEQQGSSVRLNRSSDVVLRATLNRQIATRGAYSIWQMEGSIAVPSPLPGSFIRNINVFVSLSDPALVLPSSGSMPPDRLITVLLERAGKAAADSGQTRGILRLLALSWEPEAQRFGAQFEVRN